MYSKDLERLVRSFVAQRLEREYIKYYLIETYQLDVKTAEEVIEKVAPTQHARGGSQPAKTADTGAAPPIKRQRFY